MSAQMQAAQAAGENTVQKDEVFCLLLRYTPVMNVVGDWSEALMPGLPAMLGKHAWMGHPIYPYVKEKMFR